MAKWVDKDNRGDSNTVQAAIGQGNKACLQAFAAVLKHGTLVVWGQKIVGGDSNDVATALKGADKINPHLPRILQS